MRDPHTELSTVLPVFGGAAPAFSVGVGMTLNSLRAVMPIAGRWPTVRDGWAGVVTGPAAQSIAFVSLTSAFPAGVTVPVELSGTYQGAELDDIIRIFRASRPGAAPAQLYFAIATSPIWRDSIKIAEAKRAQHATPVFICQLAVFVSAETVSLADRVALHQLWAFDSCRVAVNHRVPFPLWAA